MTNTADNPKSDPAEIDVPTIVKDEGTSAENLKAKDKLPPLEERYKESSKEAIRLAKELKDKEKKGQELQADLERARAEAAGFKDYAPFIDSLKTNPELVEHITKFWSTQEKENLQDLDTTDPIVIQDLVEKKAREIVRNELATYDKSSTQKSTEASMRQDFLNKHPDMSAKDVDDLIKWSKGNPMTYEHLYMLKNPDKISKKVAETTQSDITNQMQKITDTPASLATANSEGTPSSPVDRLFSEQMARINGAIMDVKSSE